MFHSMSYVLLVLCLVLVAIEGGCSSAPPRSETKSTVNWDGVGVMVIERARELESTAWYLVEGKAASQIVERLRESTVVESSPSRDTQTAGSTELRILAFDQRGEPMHRFFVDFQYVEGMGGKRNPNPRGYLLLEGQSKRCSSVLRLIEEVAGQPLAIVQFEEHAKKFEDIDYVFLYWKN